MLILHRAFFILHPNKMRRNIFICLSLAAVTLAVFWPLRHFGFVYYDDQLFTDNPAVNSGLNWNSFGWAFSSVVVANWHPVTSLSFVLDHQFFGTNPGAEHLVNMIFHAANAALLFLVLQKISGATWRSAMVAAIFALHPLRVESVAWVSERKDVLCGFFFLASLLAYARFVEESKVENKKSKLFFGAGLALFVLALMSKPMAVTLPFALLLLDFWPLRRFNRSTIRRLIVEKIPFFILSATFCAVTYQIQKNFAAMVSFDRLGWGQRIGNAILGYNGYLGKFFWPEKLAVIYPYSTNLDATEIWLAALLLLAISILCVWQISRRPFLAVGWFWFLGTSLPIIGLVQVGDTSMADRYTYIPLIGPAISLVWLVSEKWKREHFQKTFLAILSAATLIALAISTRLQIQFWQNSTRLFAHAIAVTGKNASAESGLGIALEHEAQTNEAMIHYQIAIAENPADKQTYYNLGNLLVAQGRWTEAEELYSNILGITPDDFTAHMVLAAILPHLNRPEEAVAHLETALQINPDDTGAMNNLAWALATNEKPEIRNGARAVQLAQRACELTHYQKTIYIGTLAAAYAEAVKFDDAIATAQKACDLAAKNGEEDLLQRNQELLQLYRAHKPFHEGAEKLVPAAN
ncbi:MAG TPA: tetratricopeptide repeat protein [Dongiaceae bacterium]|nr:tetratricopeptide repeat protein [Dongiaceae bacterium]